MKSIVSLFCVLCLMSVFSCSSQKPDKSAVKKEAPAPSEPVATAPAPEKEAPVTETLGHVKAKATEDAPELEFDVKTAVLSHTRGKFTVCISSLAGDKVLKWGFFPNPVKDEPDNQRLEIYFPEAPTAPGEYDMERFNYSAKSPDFEIDTGWTGDILSGKVIIDAMEGELPTGSGGVEPRPAKMTGSFTVTISGLHPGAFSGTFTAIGQE